MTDPIDLDLVEMRCRLRRIKTRRTKRDQAVRQSGTHWSDDDLWVYVGKERTLLIATSDGAIVCGSDDAGVRDLGLTAPRWTLERLLSEPPEGWTAIRGIGGLVTWFWGPSNGGAGCSVRIDGYRAEGQPIFYMDDLAGRAAAHRAVAELLDLLAEVSDG